MKHITFRRINRNGTLHAGAEEYLLDRHGIRSSSEGITVGNICIYDVVITGQGMIRWQGLTNIFKLPADEIVNSSYDLTIDIEYLSDISYNNLKHICGYMRIEIEDELVYYYCNVNLSKIDVIKGGTDGRGAFSIQLICTGIAGTEGIN